MRDYIVLEFFRIMEKRPLYSETKERIKQLRKTEYQIDLIMKNDCTTVEDLEDAINESLDSIKI